MKDQPDFTKLFYEYFGQTPRKVHYIVRPYPHRFHDLIFLNSLIHDSRFQRNKISMRGHRLTIPINRDCWELKYTDYEKNSVKYHELHIADARLSIFPVNSIRWSFNHEYDFPSDKELWIQSLWIDRKFDDEENTVVTIHGIDWKCMMLAVDEELLIKLHDIEVPYLFSKQGHINSPDNSGK